MRRNNRTIKKYITLFSAPNANRFSLGRLTSVVLSPNQQTRVYENEGQKRCQRKHIKNTTFNQILPFVISNLGPVAKNGDEERGRTTLSKMRQIGGTENMRIQPNSPFSSSLFLRHY